MFCLLVPLFGGMFGVLVWSMLSECFVVLFGMLGLCGVWLISVVGVGGCGGEQVPVLVVCLVFHMVC